MRRFFLSSILLVLSVAASGVVASTNVGISPAGAAEQASKSAFCSANDSLDRASANVNSNAGFLAVLKSHKADLTAMKKNAPSGTLGQTVLQAITAADAAIASNNPNDLNSAPSGSGIDTYCGVDGRGTPLPTYFNKGTGTTFCSTFVQVYQATQNASSKADVLSALTAHQAQIEQLASELSSLPKSVKAKASDALTRAQNAIASKNPSALGGGNGGGPASYVALYCGQNQ